MRQIVYLISVSLDGFMEAPNGSLDWSSLNDELFQHYIDRESTIDTYLYGRRLYENMAAFWPTADQNPSALPFLSESLVKEYSRIWKDKPKVVFSKTLDRVEWNSRLVRENMAEEVRKLKAQPGQNLSLSGAELAGSLMQLGLIDEFWLYVHPVILGGGRPVFRALREPIHLQLAETRRFEPGVVLLRYQRADTSK